MGSCERPGKRIHKCEGALHKRARARTRSRRAASRSAAEGGRGAGGAIREARAVRQASWNRASSSSARAPAMAPCRRRLAAAREACWAQ
eukprot:552565-Alexandrium_andersonii.AAC.1